ncbi:histone deacetylase HDT1 [Quillaja saponaria]|uniref:Histone deacetylase HDT1 n=1 Tax=Quillaja saponaria TaxID=32244 RepID=A0AAD7Q718_QUISA|nr:histone deacetylase HDT1 [Quillaja saponaria]
MEFWGIEVPSGKTLKVEPGNGRILHLSQACLGEVKKEKGSEPVSLFVELPDGRKLTLGILSSEKFPQISFDLVFEKDFSLSHNWKNGSVFFTGYKAVDQNSETDDELFDSEEEEDIPLHVANNVPGIPQSQVKQGTKPDAHAAKKKVNIVDPKKDDKPNLKGTFAGEDEDESDDFEDSSDEDVMNGESDEGDGDEGDSDDDDESEDEETPKKVEASKKRPLESAKKTPGPDKKAKLVTPQKTDGKKGAVHIATPHPSKQAGKTALTNKSQSKQQTPKSSGDYGCKSCDRSFKSEDALQSHNKAKHSAAK